MTPKQLRRWYHQAGVEFLAGDWKPRAENGETAHTERATNAFGNPAGAHWRLRLHGFTAADVRWWEYQEPLWPPRGDREAVERMEAFFAPYIAMLPYPKGNMLRQLFNDRLTYEEAGSNVNMTRQGAHRALHRAVRALVRLIAEDDPEFVAPEDGRRRDYEAEKAAALRVYERYERRKTGVRSTTGVQPVRSDNPVHGRTTTGPSGVRSV